MATMRISDATVAHSSSGPPASRASASALKGLEVSSLDRRPRARGQCQDEPQIMQAQQPQPEHLLLVDEMPDVRAA